MELANQTLYAGSSLIALGLAFGAYINLPRPFDANRPETYWFIALLAQFLGCIGFTLYPWVGSTGLLIGNTGQFAVDLLLVLLFRGLSLAQRPVLPATLMLAIPVFSLLWLLLHHYVGFFGQLLLTSGAAIALSVWQIGELAGPLRRERSKYLLFLMGAIAVQILMYAIRLEIASGYDSPGSHPYSPHRSEFDDHIQEFVVRLVLLICYALIFVAISNYFLDRLYRLAQQRAEDRESEMLNSLNALAMARDNETGQHVLRTQRYVRALATRLHAMDAYADQLSDGFIDKLCKATPLHDIGKVAIPDAILLKPGPLTAEEQAVMKTHAAVGERILSAARSDHHQANEVLDLGVRLAGAHHEHWDGSGYPRGLAGPAIPLEARIMALADTYDALTCERVYKAAWSHADAVREIASKKGLHYDPAVVEAFLAESDNFERIAIHNAD